MRAFSDRAIDEADLERILEAGRRAPSSRNWQPWDFVVVRERARLVELAKVWVKGESVAGSAVTVALIGPVLDDVMQQGWLHFDTGQAMMSMLIEAADMGIGSGHSAVQDQDLLRSLLGVPADRFGIALMPLGYPRDRPLAPIAESGPATVFERRALGALVIASSRKRFRHPKQCRSPARLLPLMRSTGPGAGWYSRRMAHTRQAPLKRNARSSLAHIQGPMGRNECVAKRFLQFY